MLFALLSACSLSLAGATTVYAHAHAILTRQQSYPGDAIMCGNNTITPNHLEPKFVLDKCYIVCWHPEGKKSVRLFRFTNSSR